MFNFIFSNFKLYFVHYTGLMVCLIFTYAFYVDNFKVRSEAEIPTGDELMKAYFEAKRTGRIK